ncbi:MAG: alpha/beta hydrolase [Xanthobacteraceae bacterium]|nr:alpha/beta hydrolase [Xanthobacteraceae bacterium]
MPVANVNGCGFYYEQSGKGSDLVFIHGEIHGMEYWDQQVAEFSKNHRCTIYNRRGHAKTEWTDYGFSLVNQTRDLELLFEKLDIRQPVIIGLAFGTTIAAYYAIRNPAKVRALVLGAWSEMHDALEYFGRWEQYTLQAAHLLEREGRDAFIDLLREQGGRTIYKVIPVDSPVREKVIQMFASHPLGEYQRGMLEFALSVPDMVSDFRKLDIPVLGVCGADDPYPDRPEVLRGMANFREAPQIPGAGRFANWEKPAEFNAVIGAFLQSLP